MKYEKYKVGACIKDEWVIVCELEKKGKNRKFLCYNKKNGMFKEGWMSDFLRNNISKSPNRKPKCQLSCNIFNGLSERKLLDLNCDSSFKQYIKTKNLKTSDFSCLRNIREGSYNDVTELLQRFADLLSSSGQARRNRGLCTVIGTTYEILKRRKII